MTGALERIAALRCVAVGRESRLRNLRSPSLRLSHICILVEWDEGRRRLVCWYQRRWCYLVLLHRDRLLQHWLKLSLCDLTRTNTTTSDDGRLRQFDTLKISVLRHGNCQIRKVLLDLGRSNERLGLGRTLSPVRIRANACRNFTKLLRHRLWRKLFASRNLTPPILSSLDFFHGYRLLLSLDSITFFVRQK